MAADHAAQPSDDTESNDRREASTRFERDGGANTANDTGEEHDLSYLRARRARANDPRRSLSAAFAEQNEAPNLVKLHPVALHHDTTPPPHATSPPHPPEPPPTARPLLLGRSRVFWLLSAVLFAVVAGVTFGVFYSRQTSAERATVAPEVVRAPAPAANSSLHMHVEVQGERILVSWDPRASGVQGTDGGVLTIEDAGQSNQFTLDAEQAANGSVLYRPISGNVTFRLKIRNAIGAVFNDSLRVLDPARAALQAQQRVPVEPQRAAARYVPAPVQTERPTVKRPQHQATARSPETPASSKHSRRAIARKFTPHTRSTVTSAADSAAQMPALPPAILSPTQAVAGTGLSSAIAQRAIISSITSPAAPPSQTPSGSRSVAIGTVSAAHESNVSGSGQGDFLPPQAVKQVMPKLRDSLLRAIQPGTSVGVLVTIDTHGRVKHAEIAPASRNIDIGVQKAAIDAAKDWRFEAARRNGKKVTSEHTIFFQF